MSIRTLKQSLDKALEQFTFSHDAPGSWGACICRPIDTHRGAEERNTFWK